MISLYALFFVNTRTRITSDHNKAALVATQLSLSSLAVQSMCLIFVELDNKR